MTRGIDKEGDDIGEKGFENIQYNIANDTQNISRMIK